MQSNKIRREKGNTCPPPSSQDHPRANSTEVRGKKIQLDSGDIYTLPFIPTSQTESTNVRGNEIQHEKSGICILEFPRPSWSESTEVRDSKIQLHSGDICAI
jgi:hypothetical protein